MASEVYGGGPNRGLAMQKVNGPAIGLMVTAGLGILYQLLMIVLNVLGTGFNMASMAGQSGTPEGMTNLMSGTIGIVFGIIAILVGGVVFFGAMKMRALQSWPLAIAAAVLAIIPCLSPCCCIGIPVGIWALVVLFDANVKASFV